MFQTTAMILTVLVHYPFTDFFSSLTISVSTWGGFNSRNRRFNSARASLLAYARSASVLASAVSSSLKSLIGARH